MLISVVTVCRNSEKTIKRTIESVLHQTYKEIEYIIIDGASTDDTVKIIKSYQESFYKKGYHYVYLSEQDNGIYDAMNKGISLAQGELIGIINSDDWYELNAVECAVVHYLEMGYDLFYADLRIIGRDSVFIKKAKNGRIITSRYWNHPTTFIPKRIYDKYKYKNENIHDDWDLILRIRKDGAKVCVVNNVLANFTRNGITHSKNIRKALQRAHIKYKIYRDNHYSIFYAIECYGMEIAKLII